MMTRLITPFFKPYNAMTSEVNDPILTRRANRFDVFTGPRSLVMPATDQQLRECISRMARNGHVNRLVIKDELNDRVTRPSEWPMTVIELQFLEHASGEGLDRYCSARGCERTQQYDREAVYKVGE